MIYTKIKIGDKIYQASVVQSDEEAKIGLSKVKSLARNHCMLFPFEEEQEVSFTMEDTAIPLDLVFVNSDGVVIKVISCAPFYPDVIKAVAKDVIELPINSGIIEGDLVNYDEDDFAIGKILASDGKTQMYLKSGERIFSRDATKKIIKKAKQAYLDKTEKSFIDLGRYIIAEIDRQNNRDIEFVSI